MWNAFATLKTVLQFYGLKTSNAYTLQLLIRLISLRNLFDRFFVKARAGTNFFLGGGTEEGLASVIFGCRYSRYSVLGLVHVTDVLRFAFFLLPFFILLKRNYVQRAVVEFGSTKTPQRPHLAQYATSRQKTTRDYPAI